MKSPVLALPRLAFRTTRRIAKLPLPVLAGAAALIYRKAHRSSAPSVPLSAFDGPAPERKSAPAPKSTPKSVSTSAPRSGNSRRDEPAAPREPEVVVEPAPPAEAAVDLDVEVTLPSDLPIRSYDALNATDASRAIRELEDVDEVRTVLSFEEENAKRSTVLSAAHARLAVLERAVRQ